MVKIFSLISTYSTLSSFKASSPSRLVCWRTDSVRSGRLCLTVTDLGQFGWVQGAVWDLYHFRVEENLTGSGLLASNFSLTRGQGLHSAPSRLVPPTCPASIGRQAHIAAQSLVGEDIVDFSPATPTHEQPDPGK